MEFSYLQIFAIFTIFVWSGFVRSGIGFGGAALALPLLLFIKDDPVFWLPIIATHLLFFTSITAGGRLKRINWGFIKHAMSWVFIPKLMGVIGLLSLPSSWMVIFVFSISAFYALTWILQKELSSQSPWVDRVLLIIGGYVSGASLVGAPLIAAVAVRHVELKQYRDTLFVLWFLLVLIKMTAFIVVGVDLQWQWSISLLLPAAIGHVIGLKLHDYMLQGDPALVKRLLGIGLLTVSLAGLWQFL